MKSEFRVLVVDDEIDMCESLKDMIEKEGFKVEIATNGNKAMSKYLNSHHDVIISDIVMPGVNGIELLKKIKNIDESANVIMITGYSSIESAVEAIKLGAEDYFTKPFRNIEILKIINRLYNKKILHLRSQALKQEILRQDIPEFIGQNKTIKKILSDIKLISASDVSVLVTGESGTGKELIARAIHNLSPRKNEPFIPVNCAAIPKELLESEFFGHEKGAFSGAYNRKYGLFEVADCGTLFLDEIAEMPLNLQSKILRIVETNKVRRIGSIEEMTVNTRIISATNRSIQAMIETDNFRKDLYYRLSKFTIHIPPLKDRKDDIPLIAKNYLLKKGFPDNHLDSDIFKAFQLYDWPGNVRELENVLERILLISGDKKPQVKNLPPDILELYEKEDAEFAGHPEENITLDDIEKTHITKIYRLNNGNKKKTAKMLGICLKTLYSKLNKYKITI